MLTPAPYKRLPASPTHSYRLFTVREKFIISQVISILWLAVSIVLSLPWLQELASILSWPVGILIIAGIAYIPGYLNSFLVASILLDRPPPIEGISPDEPVTILIAARNEADRIGETLRYIAKQEYKGSIQVVLVDNGSTDGTLSVAREAAERLKLSFLGIEERRPGKNFALNTGLAAVKTRFVITLDADTLLHKWAIQRLVARMIRSPKHVAAVAGTVLVRNSRTNLLTRMQEWDYFLGIASIKRQQGLYQGTLVAQGAYSLYRTDALREVGGWPDAIGEDIVMTWRIFERGYAVYFEPTAVAFTEVPERLRHFVRQRSRWARGMIEGLRIAGPWRQPRMFVKFLTGLDLFLPYTDLSYTFGWLPGLILACFGHYWIVGPYTILVLPLTLISNALMYRHQRRVFDILGLRVRRNRIGFVAYVLCYQMIMSPVSVWGYFQEFFRTRRVWK